MSVPHRQKIEKITVRRAPGLSGSRGLLIARGKAYPCLLGKNGISVNKREGDIATPSGKFALLFGFFRKDRISLPTSSLPMRMITANNGWCDEPSHPSYNRKIKLPFSASHEKLKREDSLYDIIIVMDHNYTKRIRGRGSAVFFHLTAEKKYTAGCVAVSRKTMLRLLPGLSCETVIEILP